MPVAECPSSASSGASTRRQSWLSVHVRTQFRELVNPGFRVIAVGVTLRRPWAPTCVGPLWTRSLVPVSVVHVALVETPVRLAIRTGWTSPWSPEPYRKGTPIRLVPVRDGPEVNMGEFGLALTWHDLPMLVALAPFALLRLL